MTQDHDTDPSTPGAKRVSDSRTPAARNVEHATLARPSSARPRPITDPGVAPPPEQLATPAQPMAIVVPRVAISANDSVEVLLEGIDRYQPERPRTTSQTAGEAMASYHAEHVVRPSQSLRSEPPKVVIEPRVLAPKGGGPHTATEGTSRKPGVVGRSVFLAVLAGLCVVGAIFLALRRSSHDLEPATGASNPVSTPPAVAATVKVATGGLEPPRSAETPAPAVLTAAASLTSAPAAANSASRKAAPAARSNKEKPKPLAPDTQPAASDLGEFRTSF